MTTGLIVGKFCPLHKGHQALIEFARARCDRLIILSYTKPEFPGCGPQQREAWLAALYPDATRLVLDDDVLASFAKSKGELPRTLPDNDASDEVQRAFVGWVCRAMLGSTVDLVFTSEGYGDGFAEALTLQLGRAVTHVAFDQARSIVPISGSRLRANPSQHRRYLPDTVRRSLVQRVALIGGESTGKTTLARKLAERLGTCWVPEYGRELWEQRGGDLRLEDMLAIAVEQIRREERAAQDASGWLICDTTPLVTAFYSEAMFGQIEPELWALAERPYDQLFLCAADFPFVQDGTRWDDAFRSWQNSWYDRWLSNCGIKYDVLHGKLSKRISIAVEGISKTKALYC